MHIIYFAAIVWDYYKIHILIAVALMTGIGYYVHHLVTAKDIVSSGMLLNVDTVEHSSDVDKLKQDFLGQLNVNTQKYEPYFLYIDGEYMKEYGQRPLESTEENPIPIFIDMSQCKTITDFRLYYGIDAKMDCSTTGVKQSIFILRHIPLHSLLQKCTLSEHPLTHTCIHTPFSLLDQPANILVLLHSNIYFLF